MLSVWESWTHLSQLPLRRGREYPCKPRIGKWTRPENGGSPGQGRLITLPAIWKDPWGRQAVGKALIDTGAEITFIDETWAQQNSLHVTTIDKHTNNIRRRDLQPRSHPPGKRNNNHQEMQHANLRIGYQTRQGHYIRQDWLQKNKPTIDWERNNIRLHSIETAKVPAWLEDMKKVFEDLPEEELLKRKGEFDHEINLTVDSLPKTPVIPLRPDDQAFVKDYLDTILRKRYIWISKSSMEAPLFLVPKKDSKRPVVDYQKLNDATEKDSTPLPRIDDTLDQLIGS